MKKTIILTLLIIILTAPFTLANEWSFEFLIGLPYNFPSSLTIKQKDSSNINLSTASYDSKPFKPPLYYSWRITRWDNNQAWELGLLHQKLHLKNNLSTVQHFEISHGYNLITLNKAWQKNQLIYRVGAGVVLANPDITIKNKSLPADSGLLGTGYYLAGPTFETGLEKEFPVTHHLNLTTEGKFTASYAEVPTAEGTAQVPHFALHGLLGLDYQF